MKKRTIAIIIVILLIVLLFPIRYRLKDGGSIVYKSITYQVTKVHRLYDINGIEEGWEIDLLGFRIYDNTKINIEVYPVESN